MGLEIETPNLDRLAKGGLSISQFYNSPRCCPSRGIAPYGAVFASGGHGMMTADHGRYLYPTYNGDLSEGCITLAEALKPGGYTTLMGRKWHLTPLEDMTQPNLDTKKWPLQEDLTDLRDHMPVLFGRFPPPGMGRGKAPEQSRAITGNPIGTPT